VVNPDSPWRFGATGPEFERQWMWILHNVDPAWAGIASRQGTVDPDKTPAYPRYFALNGRSGFQSLAASTDEALNRIREEDTLMSGSARQIDVRNFSLSPAAGTVRAGQLMHFVNAGLVHHQLHFHGNHLWTVRRNGEPFPRSGGHIDADGHVVLQQWEDVIEMHPLDRKASVLPLRRPPEAIDQVWNARKTDWNYPMHCHAEPSQVARGGMYPGGLVGHWTLAAPGPVNATPAHELFGSQVDFSSHQMHEGSPATEFRLTPDVAHEFKFFNRKMKFDDGGEFEMWTFETENSGRIFPAPLVRLTEGQLFHGTIRPSKKVHTVHWHGIEPDPRNDGVGHTSFEVSGSYTYQWRPERGIPGNPNVGASGTYFYHCHVNTTLHVQMGMFGPLIIDPPVHPDYPVTKGARRAFVDGPEYDIDTETILVPYSVDPRWHEMNHAAGLSGDDAGLDRFEPKHFYLLGGELAPVPTAEGPIFVTGIRARMAGGTVKPTLLRLLNANYFPVNAYFTAVDGLVGFHVAHPGEDAAVEMADPLVARLLRRGQHVRPSGSRPCSGTQCPGPAAAHSTPRRQGSAPAGSALPRRSGRCRTPPIPGHPPVQSPSVPALPRGEHGGQLGCRDGVFRVRRCRRGDAAEGLVVRQLRDGRGVAGSFDTRISRQLPPRASNSATRPSRERPTPVISLTASVTISDPTAAQSMPNTPPSPHEGTEPAGGASG
jgi:plastocyanin